MNITFFLIASSVLALLLAISNHAAAGEANTCGSIERIKPHDFTWPNFKSTLLSLPQDKLSVEGAQCLFPDIFGASDNIPIMMIKSRSLQQSNVENPRAIYLPDYYSRQSYDELMFFSFSGNKHLVGGSNYEIMRFRPNEPFANQVEMIDVNFSGGLKISEGTPVKCMKCHGTQPRFLWNEREFWPGAAGGDSKQRTDSEFNHMLSSLGKNARYSFVKPFKKGQHRAQLSSLNRLASLVNNKRLLHKIKESPAYDKYKFAIAGAVAGCYQITEFLPKRIRPFHEDKRLIDTSDVAEGREHLLKFIEDLKLQVTKEDENFKHLAQPFFDRAHYYFSKKDSESDFLFELIAIEAEKEKLGQIETFAARPISALFSTNLRYIFEGRGIGISDWAYDIIEGTYHLDDEAMVLREHSLLRLMIQADTDLDIPSLAIMKKDNHEVLSNLFAEKSGPGYSQLCDDLKSSSLKLLENYFPEQNTDLDRIKMLSDQNWEYHFSNGNKIEELPPQLPTTNINKKSCNQCHYGYSSNYTGPEFKRNNNAYPLTFMLCANCHSDKENGVGPFLPFNNQSAFEPILKSGYSEAIKYRIGDHAKMNLDHMPPILRIKPRQKKEIMNYLKSLKKQN